MYVDETGGTPLYEKNVMTTDGNGGMSCGVKMFFPENGRNADIYALHTTAVLADPAYPAAALTPESDIWWYSSTQTISAWAWYPDSASWSFSADQSGGFQAADFVFAPAVSGIRFNNYMSNPLVFYHLPVKVVVNLFPGTDIGSVSGASVSFYGYLSGTVDTTNGMITGSDTYEGWISPFRIAGTDTYTALLIPRDMTGVKFIKITLDGYDYYYTPATDEAIMEQGNTYTYNINVNKTRLTVTVVGDGITWGNSGDENTVTAEPVE